MEIRIVLPNELDDLAPEVRTFVEAMVYKLYKNRHKGKWEGMSLDSLENLLRDEVAELHDAIQRQNSTWVLLEAADIANFAMMIANVAIGGQNGPSATSEVEETQYSSPMGYNPNPPATIGG